MPGLKQCCEPRCESAGQSWRLRTCKTLATIWRSITRNIAEIERTLPEMGAMSKFHHSKRKLAEFCTTSPLQLSDKKWAFAAYGQLHLKNSDVSWE